MRFKTKLIILLFTPIRWIIIQFNKLSSYYYAEVTNKKFRKEANLAGEAWLQMPTFLIGTKYMYIGRSFSSKSGARLECIDKYGSQIFSPKLKIGDNVSLNYYCHIGTINSITIGNNVLVGSHVLITDHSHGQFNIENKDIPFVDRPLYSKGPVIIEDNVWLCDNSCILGGVTIGKGSIIAANAVVTKDIPPYSLAAGAPATIIKKLE